MTEKPKPEQDASGRFVAGNSGNGGRPKGARAVLSEAFLVDMQKAWEASGADVIATVIADRPQDFLKVVASLLPKDINLNVNPADEMTDDQLIQRIRSLDAVIRPFLSVEGAGAVDSGTGPETAH
jgi:hypothetical protein